MDHILKTTGLCSICSQYLVAGSSEHVTNQPSLSIKGNELLRSVTKVLKLFRGQTAIKYTTKPALLPFLKNCHLSSCVLFLHADRPDTLAFRLMTARGQILKVQGGVVGQRNAPHAVTRTEMQLSLAPYRAVNTDLNVMSLSQI